ncbi:MAG: hypothetical protein RR552_04995 [Oscillospiraceae bacterium]
MKKVLKNNGGVAMVMVIVLIAIMSLMGTTLYAYSVQSVATYKFGIDRNKAEYLARAGIEAAAYRYQNAVIRSSSDADLRDFIATGEAQAAIIEGNKVYLDKSGQYFSFPAGEPPEGSYVGYFEVKITNDEKAINIASIGQRTTVTVKLIKSRGYVNGKIVAKTAYILPATDALNSGWYDKDGIKLDYLDAEYSQEQSTPEMKTIIGVSNTFRKYVDAFNRSYSYKVKLKLFGKVFEYDPFKGNPPTVKADVNSYIGYGNTILNAPLLSAGKSNETGPIKFKADKKDHLCSFISMQNLFINAPIETKPDPGHFNFMSLVGNQIVINGDINMHIYYMSPSLSVNIAKNLINKFYYSTVYLQTPSSETSTVNDPAKNGCGECGKVYFNGNVFVNIDYQNEGVKRYKVFSAGDVYYFDKSFYKNDSEKINGSPIGIDLLKYFLDTSLEKGHLSGQTLQRLEFLRQVYYQNASGGSTEGEFMNNYTNVPKSGKVVSMRKVDFKKNRNVDTIYDTIPPAAVDSAGIIWE